MIRRLTSIGIAVLYVSHKLEEIFEIADTVTVLRDGRHISTKPIGEHTNDSLIQDMIGRRIENLFPRSRGTARDEVIVKVEDLSTDAKLKNVCFEAKAGEVLGFFGLMGAGRTELAKAIVGFDPIRTGRIAIGGKPLAPAQHADRQGARHRASDRGPEERRADARVAGSAEHQPRLARKLCARRLCR